MQGRFQFVPYSHIHLARGVENTKELYLTKVSCVQEACRFYMVESGFALMVAFLINVSVISVSGAICNSSSLSVEDQKNCQDLDLNKASFLLRVCAANGYHPVMQYL